jgi:hypothetical protein
MPAQLRVVARSRLAAPVQLPALAVVGGRVLAAGGLSAADASVADVVRVVPGPARRVAELPQPVHDAGAAGLGGWLYVFGGGTAGGATSAITAGVRGARVVGQLPASASDFEAARIGTTVYVVGGYAGSTPLRSVLAFRPGRPVRDVGTLPHGLRYAAVGGRLLIAGGTDGLHARSAILSFDPTTRRVRRIGRLPAPIAHAAGAALGGVFYVLGGRGDASDSQRRAILAVDPATGRVSHAGALPVALSDLGAATFHRRVLVAGGRDPRGRVHGEVWELAAR